MTEATVGDGAPCVKQVIEINPQLRGLPRGLYCRSSWVIEYMQWSRETWNCWRETGLRVQNPGTKAEHVLTDWVIDFLANRKDFDTPLEKKGA